MEFFWLWSNNDSVSKVHLAPMEYIYICNSPLRPAFPRLITDSCLPTNLFAIVKSRNTTA
jgi:hypothetical protein